jgi:hypothetical protein
MMTRILNFCGLVCVVCFLAAGAQATVKGEDFPSGDTGAGNLGDQHTGSLSSYFYVYANANDLQDIYTLFFSSESAQLQHSVRGKIIADIKTPDNQDASLRLFADNAQIKLYLPTVDIADLPRTGWAHNECEYRVIESVDAPDVRTLNEGLTKDRIVTAIIESTCGDGSLWLARYYFGEHDGLLAFALGDGETKNVAIFVPKQFYFLRARLDGFGAGIKKP